MSIANACPDGGTCHSGDNHPTCPQTCWRVSTCGPLSGVYEGDEWPADVLAKHAPHRLPEPDTEVTTDLPRSVWMVVENVLDASKRDDTVFTDWIFWTQEAAQRMADDLNRPAIQSLKNHNARENRKRQKAADEHNALQGLGLREGIRKPTLLDEEPTVSDLTEYFYVEEVEVS